jgi:hypothetical protein
MLKISAIFFVTVLSVSTAFGQSRARVFDNFDTSKGVDVVSPTVKPLVSSRSASSRSKRSKVKKTTMSVSDGVGLRTNSYSSTTLSMGSSKSLKGFSTGDGVIDSYIVDSSRRYGIDPLLIYAQMHQESAFRKRAKSHKGASGLMQLMPATARRFGVTNIYDPKQNIDAGVKYMRWLLNKFNGDVVLALAGYNAGEGAVMKYGWQVPPYRETRNYVARITRKYNKISDPSYVNTMMRSSAKSKRKAIAKNAKAKADPVYEVNIMAVRLPNGRMRLVNQ